MVNLGKITEELAIESARADLADVDITRITEDSRTVEPGSLFIARRGTTHDARRFIRDAIDAGAIAVLTDDSVQLDAHPGFASGEVALLHAQDVPTAAAQLVERFHASPSKHLTLIGVTGTNGKTTITHILKHALDVLGTPCGLIGTVTIDDGATSEVSTLTTPSAVDLSAALARMRDQGCQAAVLEVSSHALHQGRVAALDFDAGVFTNLTGDHLDYHKTLDAYADAKSTLFTMLREGAAAIINADDPSHERVTRECSVPITHCSRDPATSPHYAITPTQLSLQGIAADIHTPTGHFSLCSPLVGEHNLMNLLQVIAVLEWMGFPSGAIQTALRSVGAPAGRLEPVVVPNVDVPFAVLVDYAHTDDALDNVLRALKPYVSRTLRLVFGCGGDRDQTKRPRMGAVASRLAGHMILTSDNPRTEDPQAIINDVLAGIPSDARSRLTVEPDRGAAIQIAIESAEPGDIVLIAGKGHEDYQLLPDGRGGIVRRDFDDRRVVADVLTRRFSTPVPASGVRARS